MPDSIPERWTASAPLIVSVENETQRSSVPPSPCSSATATRWLPDAARQVAADPGPGITEAGISRASPRAPESRTRRRLSAMVAGPTIA